MMTETQERRLRRLSNRRTLYEITVECPQSGQKYLLCYSDRSTARAMREIVCSRIERIRGITSVPGESWQFGKRVSDPITGESPDGTQWQIRRSGRTQRDCILCGELEYVAKDAG
jgi:hypothetical protein